MSKVLMQELATTISGESPVSLHGDAARITPANLCHGGASVVLGLLGVAAMLIVWRRLAGALVDPLEPAAMLAVGALVTAAAVAVRLGWPPGTTSVRLDRAMMLFTSLAAAALAAGLCLPGTPVVGIVVIGILLAAEESWAWGRHVRRRAGQFSSEEIVQQLTRSLADDGTEELSGWLRTSFAAGQRTDSIHVAFCPPLAATPELLVKQIGGPTARIKTAQLLPYGARLDLKLAVAAEGPTVVLLRFSARTAREK